MIVIDRFFVANFICGMPLLYRFQSKINCDIFPLNNSGEHFPARGVRRDRTGKNRATIPAHGSHQLRHRSLDLHTVSEGSDDNAGQLRKSFPRKKHEFPAPKIYSLDG